MSHFTRSYLLTFGITILIVIASALTFALIADITVASAAAQIMCTK